MSGDSASDHPPADVPPLAEDWVDRLLELRSRRIKAIRRLQRLRKSLVFVFWNLDELKRDDYFTMADMLEEEAPTKNVDLVIVSPGGNGESGYRIGHAFQHWTRRKGLSFRVIVPLYAKSAATILALGANEIVMGLHSEIGPIDPQIPKYDRSRERWRYIPALALLDGLKLISEYVQQIPAMSKFFEQVIASERLTLDDLGLLERARESGKQYGEALLLGGMHRDPNKARAVAERLSDFYKFHGHPIDAFEAEQDLGLQIVHCEGAVWEAIKALRFEYEAFVGRPDVIPGAVVTSAIESATLRKWRLAALDPGGSHLRTVESAPEAWITPKGPPTRSTIP